MSSSGSLFVNSRLVIVVDRKRGIKVRGKWVSLRSWEKEDIPIYAEWLRNPEVTKLTHIADYPISLREIEKEFESYFQSRGAYHYGIIDNKNGELLGKFHWEECLKGPNVYDIGIIIGNPEYWNSGAGLEASYLGARILFYELNAHKINYLCAEYNRAIIDLGKRVGFKEEGVIRDRFYKGGNYINGVWLGLLREEFEDSIERFAHLIKSG